jgi:hypothetical protein
MTASATPWSGRATRPRAALASVTLALLALAPAARAQTDAERQAAREHFERGVDMIQRSRWLDAITELQAARQIRVTAPVVYNLGLAQRAVGRYREAVESFREFISLAQGRNPELVTQADGYIRELGAALGRLELRVEPPDARVQVDGATVPTAGPAQEIDPGRHVVVVQADGFATQSRAVEVARGAATVVTVRMVPVAVASHVTIESNVDAAEIRIDGAPVGFGTASETVRPGHHTIDVRAPGHASFHREFDAFPSATTRVRANLADTRTVFESPWFWVGTGVAAAGLAVGAVFLFSSTEPAYVGTWGLVDQAATAGPGRR